MRRRIHLFVGLLLTLSSLPVSHAQDIPQVHQNGQIDLDVSLEINGAFQNYCGQITNQQQAFRCRQACETIHSRLTDFSQTLARPNLTRPIAERSLKGYFQSVAQCAQLFPRDRIPAAIGAHIQFLDYIKKGGKPAPSAIHVSGRPEPRPNPGPKPAPRPEPRPAPAPTPAPIVGPEQGGGASSDGADPVSPGLATLLKPIEDVINRTKTLANMCNRNDFNYDTCRSTCALVSKRAEQLRGIASANGELRAIAQAAQNLESSVSACSLPRKPAWLNQVSSLAREIRDDGNRFNQAIANDNPSGLQETIFKDREIKVLTDDYIAAQMDFDQMIVVADQLSNRCQGRRSIQSQCRAQCAALSAAVADLKAQWPTMKTRPIDQIRPYMDQVRTRIASCSDQHTNNLANRMEVRTFTAVAGAIYENAWPAELVAVDAKDRQEKEANITEYAFTQPEVPPHFAYAANQSELNGTPSEQVMKRGFRYQDILEAYTFAAEKACSTTGNPEACAFRCTLGRDKRDALRLAFADGPARVRFEGADEIKANQCGDSLKGSTLEGKNRQVDLIIDFHDALNYRMWPEDRRPFTKRVNRFCAPVKDPEKRSPFLGMPACEYASALYYGDFAKALDLDERGAQPVTGLFDGIAANMVNSFMSEPGAQNNPYIQAYSAMISRGLRSSTDYYAETFSLSHGMMQAYFFGYQQYYGQCLRSDSTYFTTYKSGIEIYTTSYGTDVEVQTGPDIVHTYRVNKEFQPVLDIVSTDKSRLGMRQATDMFSRLLGVGQAEPPGFYSRAYRADREVSLNQALRFIPRLMQTRSCSDPVVKKLERQFIKYVSEVRPAFLRLKLAYDAAQGRQ